MPALPLAGYFRPRGAEGRLLCVLAGGSEILLSVPFCPQIHLLLLGCIFGVGLRG